MLLLPWLLDCWWRHQSIGMKICHPLAMSIPGWPIVTGSVPSFWAQIPMFRSAFIAACYVNSHLRFLHMTESSRIHAVRFPYFPWFTLW
jgi:hypothetical protein